MVYGLIDGKNHKFYTYLSKVFEGIKGEQKNYNWLITDCECYPDDKETEALFNQEYCWISGDKLTEIIEKEDFQWVWGVLSGFEKDISLDKVLKYPLPNIQDNFYFNNPVSLQHPLSTIEIVSVDSSLTLVISKKKELLDNYFSLFPDSQELNEFNER